MDGTLDIWKLIAGLGLFLFGMFLLEESVRALSGKTLRRLIWHYTKNRLRAVGAGTLVTSILQSSAAVSLMVLAFVGAGVMSMENAIGVIMGANIGTTFTAWIVATLGFKLKIESFAFPFIGLGGVSLMFFSPSSRSAQLARLLCGFGLLFLGLDYMKTSVEGFALQVDLAHLPDYSLWFYVLLGIVITAVMQSSSVSIAIVLTALHSSFITFPEAAAMVIGANVGTTITVLIGALGGSPSKKRVAMSHLLFNLVTGLVALLGLDPLVALVAYFFDPSRSAVMGLALFHTIFNILGVLIFFPLVSTLAKLLVRMYPEQKAILSLYLNSTPVEVVDAASAALRKEIAHLLAECQVYNLRVLKIDETLIFDEPPPFEKNSGKRHSLESLYESIKRLHAEIFEFYSRLQTHNLDANETRELERIIYASRNIMNSIKNFKGIRHDLDEFDAAGNTYLNTQYQSFRKRLAELYHDMNRVRMLERQEEQYRRLLAVFLRIEEDDRRFIRDTMNAVAAQRVQEMEISSLLMVNRLFTQACRLQVFSMKDLLLTKEQVTDFDKALDTKELIDEEKVKSRESSGGTEGPASLDAQGRNGSSLPKQEHQP